MSWLYLRPLEAAYQVRGLGWGGVRCRVWGVRCRCGRGAVGGVNRSDPLHRHPGYTKTSDTHVGAAAEGGLLAAAASDLSAAK